MSALSRVELSRFLPHGESMCLLSSVEYWDESSIVCESTTHREPHNPLFKNGKLDSICGVEYAAQAMAVHTGLTTFPTLLKGPLGFLGGIRDLKMAVSRLDQCPGNLVVRATLLLGQQTRFMYAFSMTSETVLLLAGRASIFLTEGQA
ncbi:MAG: 3-hydroxylacyl-ACP dehydratase [Nitrospirales bacterium]|nr:3-hydroxylacyl-ACP dehydratase [Nitrospirales bacterium]